MKKIVRLTIIISVFVSAFSCKKDFRNSLDPVIPYDSAMRLSAVVLIDTTISSTDTTEYRYYIYDNKRRVVAINIYDYNDSFHLSHTISYSYSGSDSLPLSSTNNDTDTLLQDSYTAYYFYDNTKRLIEDSSLSKLGVNVSYYTYTGTTITARHKDLIYTLPFTPAIYADTAIIGIAGEIIKTFGMSPTLANYIHSFIYDTLANPFYQLNIHYASTAVPRWNYSLYDINFEEHNVTSLIDESLAPAGSADNRIYTYTYNYSRFPETIHVSYSSGSGKLKKIIFIYRNT